MDEFDVENLIERGLSAKRPRPAFREQLLSESTQALVRRARMQARWRKAGLAAAAVLVGAVSFLGGRLSVPRSLTPNADPALRATAETEEVRVPDDLVAWLDAANLFRQLGMEDRMARAVERASQLRRRAGTRTERNAGQSLGTVAREKAGGHRQQTDLADVPRGHESVPHVNGIMAHSLGGYSHASERD